MGIGSYVLTIGALAATLAGSPDLRSDANWVGVWQGEVASQPAVTITLGRDGEDLEGTIVFDMWSREGGQPRIIGHDAHVMIHLRVDGNVLVFDVIRRSDAKDMHWTMRLTGEDKGVLECPDCGGPPTVELTRIR